MASSVFRDLLSLHVIRNLCGLVLSTKMFRVRGVRFPTSSPIFRTQVWRKLSSSIYKDVKGGPCNSKNRISVCPTILSTVGHAVGHVRPTANSRGSRRALEDNAST